MRLRGRVAAVVVAGTALGVGLTVWRAGDALRRARQDVEAESLFRFTASAIDRTPPPNVEYFATPAAFRQGIVYRGRLYLCSAAGLFTEGGEWRVGQHLPPAPLVAMSVGLSSDSHEPELWIATAGEGLLAFNGSKFRHIRPHDPAHRKLTSVLALSSGRLLLGTERAGVLVYDGRTLSRFHDEFNDRRIFALAGDADVVWIGTDSGGLFEHRAGELYKIAGLPAERVLSLAVHRETLYAGTAMGTVAIRDRRVQRIHGEGMFAQAVLAGDDELTIGTLEQGVAIIPIRSGRVREFDRSGSTTSLVKAGDRILAVGAAGVFDVRAGTALRLPDQALLSDRNISALAEDKRGRLWIGYFDRGMDVLDGGRVRHLEDDNLFCVNRIVHAPEHTVVATANGLVFVDGDGRKRQVLGRKEGLIADHATDVALTPEGMVVVTPAGLSFLGVGAPRGLYAFHGLVSNHGYAVELADGTLFLGTLGGISILRGEVVQANYTTANSRLPHNWITAVARVRDEWWFGTYGEGVHRLNAQGQIISFPDMPRAVVNPNAMLVSGDTVYVGTLEHGLLVHSSGRWQNVSAGLPSMNVTALARCGAGVCVGTDNGLVRLR